ncbi:MAG TPA: CoA-binding protein, partial [Longimicrobiales bacterium]|nr:CoA-binding protein [Longimicrobiales bacterium]
MSEATGGHPLAPIFEPRSVAVIGASTDPKKRGYQVLRALRESGFAGRVLPVNPKGGDILGYPVATSV